MRASAFSCSGSSSDLRTLTFQVSVHLSCVRHEPVGVVLQLSGSFWKVLVGDALKDEALVSANHLSGRANMAAAIRPPTFSARSAAVLACLAAAAAALMASVMFL